MTTKSALVLAGGIAGINWATGFCWVCRTAATYLVSSA
jgi:hypothetical protein